MTPNARARVIARSLPVLAAGLQETCAALRAHQTARRSIVLLFVLGAVAIVAAQPLARPVIATMLVCTIAMLTPAVLTDEELIEERAYNLGVRLEKLVREGSQRYEHCALSERVKAEIDVRLTDALWALQLLRSIRPRMAEAVTKEATR